jgi:hypothetical protein
MAHASLGSEAFRRSLEIIVRVLPAFEALTYDAAAKM